MVEGKSTIKVNVGELQKELEEIKAGKQNRSKGPRLRELALQFAQLNEFQNAKNAFQLIVDERERNLTIAEIIEDFLLPSQETGIAKDFVKFITPTPEILPLVSIHIALSENDRDLARQIIRTLPSPLARNFAFMQLIETYFMNREKDMNQARQIGELMLENAKMEKDQHIKSYLLRDIAINLYLANHEKGMAKEAAALIPDAKIRDQVLRKIG